MSRNLYDLVGDISGILDEVECEYTSVMEERDDLREKIKDLDEQEKEFPKAYDLGFEEGFAKGEQSMQEKANKICEYWEENNTAVLSELFDGWTWTQIFRNIEKAYNKIIEYEKKEQEVNEIHVGDELVGDYGFKYIVTKLDGKEVCLVDNHGDIRHTFLNHEAFTKTGKHYPLEEMLKELK